MTSFDIYDHATQQQIDNFKPTFLYIKQHKLTGLLYFGKTVQTGAKFKNYKGSGSYWSNHLKIHGPEHVENLWYCLFTDINSLVQTALCLSETMNIINEQYKPNRKLFANEVIENGIGGNSGPQNPVHVKKRAKSNTGKTRTDETKKKMSSWIRSAELGEKISKTNTGIKKSDKAKENMRLAQLGNKQSEETIKKRMDGIRNGKGFGHKISDEVKKQISDKLKGKPRDKEAVRKGVETRLANKLKISLVKHIEAEQPTHDIC